MGCSKVAKTYELIIASRLLVGICAGKEPCPRSAAQHGGGGADSQGFVAVWGFRNTGTETDPTQAPESVPRPHEWALGTSSP